ncbi:MAG TPA: transposase domain-containing protein [Chthoniobacterales bacterium]
MDVLGLQIPAVVDEPNRHQSRRKCDPSHRRWQENWLFFGDVEAGERSAVLYTIIESCRRRGIEPYAYLRDVLTRLSKMTNWRIKDVTPEAWAKARKPALPKAA